MVGVHGQDCKALMNQYLKKEKFYTRRLVNAENKKFINLTWIAKAKSSREKLKRKFKFFALDLIVYDQ